MQKRFYLFQIVLGVSFLILGWLLFRRKVPESQFRVREADLRQGSGRGGSEDNHLANSKMKQREPLSLPGIRIDGTPYEILGVPHTASVEEIQKAYRDLMKRFHPDRVGPPGSRAWTDAQKIAEAINRAKQTLLSGRAK